MGKTVERVILLALVGMGGYVLGVSNGVSHARSAPGKPKVEVGDAEIVKLKASDNDFIYPLCVDGERILLIESSRSAVHVPGGC